LIAFQRKRIGISAHNTHIAPNSIFLPSF
jgi:hypothetical protein